MSSFRKENKQTTALAEKLRDHCIATLKYGDTLTYAAIEELTGLTREHKHWHAFKTKFFKMARKAKGWCFKAESNVGYQLLTPAQTVTDRMRYRSKKSVSQGRMAKNEASAVRDSELPQHMRQVKYQAIEYQNRMRKAAMMTSRVLNALVGGSK